MGLLDSYMSELQLDPQEVKKQQLAALLQGAGVGLLSAPWNRGGLFNAASMGLQGANAVPGNLQQAQRQKFQDASSMMDFAQKRQAFDDEEKARSTLQNFQRPAPLPSMAPTNANAAALSQAPKATQYDRMMSLADEMEKHGLVKYAERYREQAQKFAPKYKGMETVMKDGKPVLLQAYENQAPTEMQGYQPKPDYKQRDMGGAVDFYDPLSNTAVGRADKTQTPDSLASNALTIRGQNITMRGQDMVDNRSADANSIAAGVKLAENTKDLRKEYNALDAVKNYRAAAPLVASAKNAPDTPAGDLDLIYAVGKALDPNSVVREGELNLVIKSGSPLQRFQGYVNYIANGRGRLPPAQRQQLLEMLNNRVGQLRASHDQAAEPYIRQAQSLGLPMDQVFQLENAGDSGALSPAEQREYEQLKKRFGRQ